MNLPSPEKLAFASWALAVGPAIAVGLRLSFGNPTSFEWLTWTLAFFVCPVVILLNAIVASRQATEVDDTLAVTWYAFLVSLMPAIFIARFSI